MTTTMNTINQNLVSDPAVDALFETALAASLKRQSDVAIPILEQVLARNPCHARARHLLGAEFAQAGKMDDAVVEITTALELNPDMPLARFQLGLMLMTCARTEEAVQVWSGLDVLESCNVLNRFRRSMMMIVQGQMQLAHSELAAAIADNIDLPALNGEMREVIEMIASANSPVTSSGNAEVDEVELNQDDPNAQHFLVSTYVQSPTIH